MKKTPIKHQARRFKKGEKGDLRQSFLDAIIPSQAQNETSL